MSCKPSQDKFLSKESGECCDRCPAGTFLKSDCNETKRSECSKCEHGSYTATKNHNSKCLQCRECSSINHQRKMSQCSADRNTVCECVPGFFCSNQECDHCQAASRCPPGEGVQAAATRTDNTICAPCGDGTFSNVTDLQSVCKPHTRCEDLGRIQISRGTSKTDAVCGDFRKCSWMLPAGLWSGLVLTVLVLVLVFVLWRSKRGCCRAASSKGPVPPAEKDPAPPVTLEDFSSHCQETCMSDTCKIPIFNPADEDEAVISVQDSSEDTCLPITPLKASVSFAEFSLKTASINYCPGNFLRSYSEPQEDEYCGT